jgi:hypothetical protein
VFLNRGCTWREQLTIPANGITVGAYGTGAKPIINGADVVTAWSLVGGTTYNKTVATAPKIVLYNGTRLTSAIFAPTETAGELNEKFEAAGYDTAGWSENGTPDEDASVVAAGSPSGWGSSCLKVDAAANTDWNCFRVTSSNLAISYSRLEFVITAHSLTNEGDKLRMSQVRDAAFGAAYGVFVVLNSGSLRLHLWSYHDGNVNDYTGFPTVAIGTRYNVEVKWDATNDAWAWKIDGVTQPNNVDASSPVTSEGTLTLTHVTHIKNFKIGAVADGAASKAHTVYYDKVAINTTDWVDGLGTQLSSNTYNYTGTTLAVNVGQDPATLALEAGQRDYALFMDSKDNVTLTDLALRNANVNCLRWTNANNLTVTSVDCTQSAYSGVQGVGAATSLSPTLSYMDVSHGGGCGILIDGDADQTGHVWVHHCTVHDNGWSILGVDAVKWNAAIKVWGGYGIGSAGESDYCTIEDNECYNQVDNNGDYSGGGIWLDEWGTNGIIRRNTVRNNATYGILIEHTEYAVDVSRNLVYANRWGISPFRGISNAQIYHNVVYGNSHIGIWCQGGETQAPVNNLFRNNISVGNTVNLSATAGGENAGSGSGNVYEYNALGPEAAGFIEWGTGVYKATYTAFETAYGGTTHSVKTDPLFVNAATPDFHLQAGSPCINAGLAIVGINDGYSGSAPDIGAYETDGETLAWVDVVIVGRMQLSSGWVQPLRITPGTARGSD